VGLEQVKTEILDCKKARRLAGDRFVEVMEPFVKTVQGMVTTLRDEADTLDSSLKSLLAYYGETSESGEGPKPEEFFGLIMSFSSALQKASIEVHAADPEIGAAQPVPSVSLDESQETPERGLDSPTLKRKPSAQTLQPPSSLSPSMSGRLTIGRGDLDEAIRSIRGGQRLRARQTARPLSKMFLDGSSPGRPTSHLYDS